MANYFRLSINISPEIDRPPSQTDSQSPSAGPRSTQPTRTSSPAQYRRTHSGSGYHRADWNPRHRRSNFAPLRPQAFSLEEISHYDERGPAGMEQNRCGEHTDTHCDATFTGDRQGHANKATHNIPVERFIGPACVIDCCRAGESESGLSPAREAWRSGSARKERPTSLAWPGFIRHPDWSLGRGSEGVSQRRARRLAHSPGFIAVRAVPGKGGATFSVWVLWRDCPTESSWSRAAAHVFAGTGTGPRGRSAPAAGQITGAVTLPHLSPVVVAGGLVCVRRVFDS